MTLQETFWLLPEARRASSQTGHQLRTGTRGTSSMRSSQRDDARVPGANASGRDNLSPKNSQYSRTTSMDPQSPLSRDMARFSRGGDEGAGLSPPASAKVHWMRKGLEVAEEEGDAGLDDVRIIVQAEDGDRSHSRH